MKMVRDKKESGCWSGAHVALGVLSAVFVIYSGSVAIVADIATLQSTIRHALLVLRAYCAAWAVERPGTKVLGRICTETCVLRIVGLL